MSELEPKLDFNHWDGPRRGVGSRRWVITSTGLRQLTKLRFFKLLLFVAWTAGVAVALAGFVFTQTLSETGWLATLAAKGGPRPQAIMSAVSALLLIYPDILVAGMFKWIFWLHSYVGMMLCMVALAILVPSLITRDRASSALTIYLSRPLTSRDYLLGKFVIIIGVMLMLWTGPLVAGWLLSVLFAPDMVFARHSFGALGNALLFNLIGLVVVSAVAFAVSAFAKTAAAARLWWIGLWIVLGTVAGNPFMPAWVRHASFTYDLGIMRDEVFNISGVLGDAAGVVPMLSAELATEMNKVSQALARDELHGALIGLALLVGGSLLFFMRRVKPE
ncbi:ABC transporter permease subunit [Actomonas aquatica]|uniref:ABC transporter permease subunit n=1 Tax=Actomonas aquatica TaxID=2866162 RepID=A0ABZ1C398_9BACT|nr:ABC transporter permease subunit [Opitutus sp. WL0086]WRQ85817.1 ABC transporter permease subunit [Opitutus sp. WL0086]